MSVLPISLLFHSLITKQKQFPMRGLLSSKTIASTYDKKSSTRIARQLPSLHYNEITYDRLQHLIVPSDYLPINLEVEEKDQVEIELNLTHQSLSARSKGENVSIPVSLQRQRWIKINFWQEVKRVHVKSISGNRRADRKQMYMDSQEWKRQQKQQATNCYQVSIQPIMQMLRAKGDKQERRSELGFKNSISSFMKTKFSEKGHFKSNNAIVRRADQVAKEEEKKETSSIAISRSNRHDSQTLELENLLEEEKKKDRRESNASTSIRIQSRENIKFSRRIKKLRDLAQSKNIYSQKETPLALEDTSHLFPMTKMRPRFYQHINLSQQQIDVKRRKFDSQFITKKSMMPSTNLQIPDKQANQSQVTQDICKMQGSKSLHALQDTLQRGMQQNNQAVEESGTLCESVYE